MLTAAIVAGFAMFALAVAFVWRAHDQERLRNIALMNCEQIELLKAQVRPDPFDRVETVSILEDLNIDPDSERGRRLLEKARKSNEKEREELAPRTC